MSMVDLMWLFCGAFVGSLVTIFIIGMLNASRDEKELEQARLQIDALKEDKKALKRLLKPAADTNTKVCPICGYRYDAEFNNCPICGRRYTEVKQ